MSLTRSYIPTPSTEPLCNELSANVHSTNARCGKAFCTQQGTTGTKMLRALCHRKAVPKRETETAASHSIHLAATADFSQPPGYLEND